MNELSLTICALALIVLGYGIRLLQEAAREWSKARETPSRDDYIDWAKVPEGYNWVAVDGYDIYQDGTTIRMYEEEPHTSEYENYFVSDSSDDMPIPAAAIIGPLPPWRESFRRRPGSDK